MMMVPHVRVIGARPPGMGDGHMLRLKPPVITRSAKDWDTCEEEFWVSRLDLPELLDGAERTGALMGAHAISATGRFWVTGFTPLGHKACLPVIRLISKGWYITKAEHWDGRRANSGDVSQMNLGGFAYAVRTWWSETAGSLAYVTLAAPTTNFGLTGVVAATYNPSWPYNMTGVTPGWYQSAREINRLPNVTAAVKIVDTYARLMKYDGTNGT